MEAEEGQLSGVQERVVLEADGNLERRVALGASSVPGQPVLVRLVAQVVEHQLVPPGEDAVADLAQQLRIAGSTVPVDALRQALANVELQEIRPVLHMCSNQCIYDVLTS